YGCHFLPYLFTASAIALSSYAIERDGHVKMQAAAASMVVATILFTAHWGAFPPNGTIRGGFVDIPFSRPTLMHEQKARDLADLPALIPSDAKFAVSEEELPHVAERLNVLTLKYSTTGAEYVLYGTSSMGAGVGAAALASGEFVEIASRPGL